MTPGLDTLLERAVVPGYTRLGYRLRSRSWPADDPRPNALVGKTAVVTGARSGLGKATAARLAELGAAVHLVVRDAGKAARTVADLRGEVPGATFVLDECDVSDLDAVRRYAATLTGHIDVLVHNAGVMPAQRTESPQGHELTLATHVLGPLLLTELLRSNLRNGRVVFVASGGMYTQPLPADPEYREAPYRGATAYARTKRIQVALTPLLAAHLAPTFVATMHPGWCETPGLTESLPAFTKLTRPFLRTPAQGADTTIWLAATTPTPPTGKFWHDRRTRPPHYRKKTQESEEALHNTWTYCHQATAP
ncbi:SDR family NAD(P)-dependent oxidoreductase [Kribbella shirazensis]|uniref:NAD(P)-dependent dehydrogenase (Short-subunit alcohol dehydrogenase family) n=1 Tax=Kribbella shirazensis TaxID=1105143 RepID=A0A7X5VAJ4_9ACTN|nr:SDR family NAD(P)-dependent oxidoreductase [Kribbella shirazensis]NIK57675.1 NAD(P)-dependent dehydrogenase (short-subunit alcohol dehydrogenase family) [Kribbella shirazensis]